jgi:potassium efflux system protein
MLWYVMMLLIPIGLTVLSVAGYQYTTMILTTGFKNTANVGIVLAISGGMLLRWLLVRRRFLTMEEVRKARAAVPVAIASEASAIPAELAALNKAEQPLLDIASVNRQAREVVVFALSAVGAIWLLWIWRDALPAIEYLEHNELWSVAIGEKIEVVSSRDLLFAGLSFFLTFLMIKNMPGLLNLAAQTYSTLDSGTRYAATTVFRYLITIIGVITGLSFLSIPWSQYSWLVAAATVGIGFGLQEIVANFVSGLILLIERPVRVGDWITIDGTTGVVTKIQMRATTVTNFDNQELVVPNKDLITGKLLNWTLSSVTTRLVLNVGVAYGTDTEFVKKMITDIVKAHPFVLSSPEPAIVLQEFADSALMFVVRVFLPSVENRENVRHELNTSILHAFAEHQISIPFPQRDLHIVTPGWTPEIERSESKRKPRTKTEEQE